MVAFCQGYFLCPSSLPGPTGRAWGPDPGLAPQGTRGATLQPSHPPACPDLLQTLCLACQHLLPASSLPPSACLFFFLNHAAHGGSHPEEVVFWRHPSALCSPPMPCSPGGDATGGWGLGQAGRQAASSGRWGFVSPWLLVLLVESGACMRASPCLSVSWEGALEGSLLVLALLLALSLPPLEELGRIGVRTPSGECPRPLAAGSP